MCGKERSKVNGWGVSLHVIHKWLPFCMVSENCTCLVGEWVQICVVWLELDIVYIYKCIN
jgi:hypothetical protein